ncbi:MAG: hypothetical protein V4676_09420 [Bacteroidota bacterium]
MKTIFFSLFLLPAILFAQECKVKKETDGFTRQPKISTGFMKLSSTAGIVSLNMVADAKEVRLLFSMGEGACFDEEATAAFSFDGTRTKSTQKNTSVMNCDGIFTIIFRNSTSTPMVLNKLATQKLTSIVIVADPKQKTEIVLKDTEKQMLLEKAACLVKEAKLLIKPA